MAHMLLIVTRLNTCKTKFPDSYGFRKTKWVNWSKGSLPIQPPEDPPPKQRVKINLKVYFRNTEVSVVKQLPSFISRYDWESEKQLMIEEHDIDHGSKDDDEDDTPGPDHGENYE